MVIQKGQPAVIDSWMELVKAVSWNFPGLETPELIEAHKRTVLRFMADGRALCVIEQGKVVGVLLFSRKHNMICCLAVSPDYRRKGIACTLLNEAFKELDRGKDITVTTFREEDEKGAAPRALYRRFGFTEGKLCVENDYPLQEFVLKAEKMFIVENNRRLLPSGGACVDTKT